MPASPPKKKVQRALGRKFHKLQGSSATNAQAEATGDRILTAFRAQISYRLSEDNGSDLVSSIHSDNLRNSAAFASRGARLTYLLGKVTLLSPLNRKHVVRAQIMEYGSVCEAILLDVVQSVGKHNAPGGARPRTCNWGKSIDWSAQGLFTADPDKPNQLYHGITFSWLIQRCYAFGVFRTQLNDDIHQLRLARNLVHPVIPASSRYRSDLDAARNARRVVERTRDAAIAFKHLHGLP